LTPLRLGTDGIRGVDRRKSSPRLGNVGDESGELIVAEVLADMPKPGGDLIDERGTTYGVAVRRSPESVRLVVGHMSSMRQPGAS